MPRESVWVSLFKVIQVALILVISIYSGGLSFTNIRE